LQLDLALKDEKGGDISSFITNGEWDLIGKNSQRHGGIQKWLFVSYQGQYIFSQLDTQLDTQTLAMFVVGSYLIY
jgi:hypothetical protein